MADLLTQKGAEQHTQNVFDVEITKEAIYHYNRELLELLLRDRTTQKNIIWATSDYEYLGYGYCDQDEIKVEYVARRNGNMVRPRTLKALDTKADRTRDKAEVFTPSWICNQQNNLIDRQWFGREHIFNIETEHSWQTIQEPVEFSNEEGRTWQDYVVARRMEITCGEAPYLVSRYDTVSGEKIPVKNRIGLLDRKLRVVGENCQTEVLWLRYARKAYQSVYGYEYQGDNLLIARINLLSTFIEYYQEKFEKIPTDYWLRIIADIITWNLWQMDGLKAVVPLSCRDEIYEQFNLFGPVRQEEECPGCRFRDIKRHNGMYCKIADWDGIKRKEITYLSLLGGGQK